METSFKMRSDRREYNIGVRFDRPRRFFHLRVTRPGGWFRYDEIVGERKYVSLDHHHPLGVAREIIKKYELPDDFEDEIIENNGVFLLDIESENQEPEPQPEEIESESKPNRNKILFSDWETGEVKYI